VSIFFRAMSCFDVTHKLPTAVWDSPRGLLCQVGSNFLCCDPQNRLWYGPPSDVSNVLNCSAVQNSMVVANNGCQGLPFRVIHLIGTPAGLDVLAVGARDVAVVHIPTLVTVTAGRSNTCHVRRLGGAFGGDSTVQIVECRWHPLSSSHVVVLTDDSCLHIFNFLKNSDYPEQSFRLETGFETGAQGYSPLLREPDSSVVGFGFLQGPGWNPFTVLYATGLGDVYAIAPIVPCNTFLESHLFDDLPGDESIRDSWKAGILKAAEDPELGEARVVMAREPMAEYVVCSPIPVIFGEDSGTACTAIEVLALEPPVVALGFERPIIKLYTMSKPFTPAWDFQASDVSATSPSELGFLLFASMNLHVDAAPPPASAVRPARTLLIPDASRPDRLLGCHAAEGVFLVQLPAFFLPTSDDRQLPLESPHLSALRVAAPGPWPTVLGALILAGERTATAAIPMDAALYTLKAEALNNTEFRLSLETTPIRSHFATHALKPSPPATTDKGPGAERHSEEQTRRMKSIQEKLAALERQGTAPVPSRPLQPTAADESDWANLFKQLVAGLQQDKITLLRGINKEVEQLGEETQKLNDDSLGRLPKLAAEAKALETRKNQAHKRLSRLAAEQASLLASHQRLVDAVLRKATGHSSTQQQQLLARLELLTNDFIPRCGARLDALEAAVQTPQPKADEIPAPRLSDVERVTAGTLEHIAACRAIADSLAPAVLC